MREIQKSEEIHIKVLPNSEVIIHALDRIVKAFEDRIQVELIKVRWEEIKELQSSNQVAAI